MMLTKLTLRRLFATELRRSVLRVEGQNKTWSHNELERHAEAFSNGIQELGLKGNDKIVTWLDPKHATEIVTIQYGALKSGITLIPVFSDNANDFFKAVKDTGAKAAIISPNRRANGNLKQSEILLNNIDELKGHHAGSPLKLKQFPALKYIIQTGFYGIPGVYKFRDILLYANKNFLGFKPSPPSENATAFQVDGKDFSSASLRERALKVSEMEGDTIAVICDPNCPKAFTNGVLPSILSNKYTVIFSKAEEAGPILKNFTNPIIVHDEYTDTQTLNGLSAQGLRSFVNTASI